jgi:penicillin amidase
MAVIFRWLLRIFTGLVVVGLCLLYLVYLIAARSLPDYDEDFQLAGIQAPVRIVRDTASVPHIYGQSDEDVMFGLGFSHAQDRLWQMLMFRRTAQGRLSEYFGERTVEIDDLIRRYDLYGAARRSVGALSADTQRMLAAYSRGVNAWLGQINTGARGRGAPEFFVFPAQIAPWQPADSVAIGKLMALQMAGHLQDEVLRARVALVLSPDRLKDILPDVPGTGTAELPEYSALFESSNFAAVDPNSSQHMSDPLMPVPQRGLAGASNAWAASPVRSATGASLLANDPHLGFTAPAIWYLARIELSTGGVIGGTIPGLPAVLVGRSASLGWGLTSAYVDDQDVFIEKVNPDNPNEVLTPEGYKPIRSRPSIININGQPPRTITLQWSENGPILPGRHYGLDAVIPAGHVASVGWTALSDQDTSVEFAFQLMRSKSVSEALAAGRFFVAPAQNLTLADSSSIAMKTIGALPRRSANHQSFGRLPAPGWRAENRWQGMLDYSANPEFSNPAGGILGNTNNKIVDRPFPFHVSYEWGDTQRIERWRRLMQTREVHTRESFIEAQLDTVSYTARSLLPLIGADLWFAGASAPEGTAERQRQRALALLREWNGEMSEHLPEPLIYATWLRSLQNRLARDELGPLSREFNQVEPLFIERVFRNIDGAGVWCDVVQSAPVETCNDIARIALDDALIWIQENFGGELESLRWGDAHQATHDHAVLGEIPGLSAIVNIRQSTSGGDNTLMRGKTIGTGPNPFLNVHGAGFRGVYDFADPDASVFISSTGQSGHFLSRHYDDLGQLWRRGEYVPMSLNDDLARAGSVGEATLTPLP